MFFQKEYWNYPILIYNVKKLLLNTYFMKYFIWVLVLLLPFHAFLVTVLKCKFWLDTNYLRFWKEFIIIILLTVTFVKVMKENKLSLKKIYENNYLLWTVTAFIICSFIYIFFPFFEIKASAFLGFRYDVFFFFTLIIGLYLSDGMKYLHTYLKLTFWSALLVLAIFLPWYLFWDISALTSMFGYSSEVSTYNANSCISFAQNVNGQHRFQATFGGPIRFSVFLTIFYIIYVGFILDIMHMSEKVSKKSTSSKLLKRVHEVKERIRDKAIIPKSYSLSDIASLIGIPSMFVFTAIFFSYSKTSLLGLAFGITFFILIVWILRLKRKITRKFMGITAWIFSTPIILVAIFKADLFLHLGAIINRLDNLGKSVEMFFYNPIWYGLGIAGPASQIGKSIESAGNWQIATSTATTTHRFLPENWYVQILLEQWFIGLSIFVAVMIIIWLRLYGIAKSKRDYLSISIFTAYITLCFMANFTHAFEEAATSYTLFLIIWIVIGANGIKKLNTK